MTEAVTPPVKTPEWLLLLETKKNRPHRLAHEIGAGAPCLICEEKCPGLDLHFWRKLCRNCKCKKEDHDVKDDDGYEQFEILLGAGGKRKKPGAMLKIKVPEVSNNATRTRMSGNKSVPFDWVPPNVSEDVAAQYMEQLPSAKLPISGSDGALYRKQQLERQMPLHDLDASRCHNLTPHEIEELQKYLDNLKNNVVGQGRVTKVPTLYTEERISYRVPAIERNSSHQLAPLPSSRSEQSLRSMPPLPSKYNATPRPFIPEPNAEDLPPPLPTSLPPDETESNLKTPGSFMPNMGSMPSSEYQFHCTGSVPNALHSRSNSSLEGYNMSSQYPHDVAYSTAAPGQLASDFSQLHLNRDALDLLQENNHLFASDGSKSKSQFSSNIIHSSEGPGQLAPSISQALQSKNNIFTYQDGSSPLLTGHMQNITCGVEDSTCALASDGLTMHSYLPQDIASSTSVAGRVAPGMSQLHQARGTSGYPNDGSNIHSHHPQDIVSSASITGQVAPGMSQLHQARSTSGYPNDGSNIHSHHPQDIASSASVTGQVAPGMSQLHQARSTSGYPNDGSNIHSHHPQDIASSASGTGRVAPGMSQLHQARGNSGYPNDGSNIHSHHPQDIVSSASADGQQDGSCAPGTFPAGATNYGTSNQVNAGDASAHEEALLNNPLRSQESNEPWAMNAQIPAPSHYERTLQPQFDVSVSSDVNGDSMPRSAHIMHQSKPIDSTLATQLNLSAQQQNVQSHLNCQHCKEVLAAGDVAVFADRAGDNTAWHPNCFVCQTCDELLVDLIYFFNKGNVYCGRHFAELLNIPRCFACDELIFVKEYTVAEGKTFHVKHFCCYECDDPLAGKQYIPTDDQPICLDCYQEIFGKRCHTCGKQIAAGERRVGWKELNWHAVEECFRCHGCNKSLLGGRFVMKDEQPYCNKDCVNLLPA